jgi:hypothetical protein
MADIDKELDAEWEEMKKKKTQGKKPKKGPSGNGARFLEDVTARSYA